MSKPAYNKTFFEPIAEIPPEIIDRINARIKERSDRDVHRQEFEKHIQETKRIKQIESILSVNLKKVLNQIFP